MGKRSQVTNEDYAIAYKASKSFEELAEKLGMSVDAVKQRKKKLEDGNVIFPPFPVKPKIDAAALNALLGTTPPATDAPATDAPATDSYATAK